MVGKVIKYWIRLWYANIRHPIYRFRYWRECLVDSRRKEKEKKQIQELVSVSQAGANGIITECCEHYEEFKDV